MNMHVWHTPKNSTVTHMLCNQLRHLRADRIWLVNLQKCCVYRNCELQEMNRWARWAKNERVKVVRRVNARVNHFTKERGECKFLSHSNPSPLQSLPPLRIQTWHHHHSLQCRMVLQSPIIQHVQHEHHCYYCQQWAPIQTSLLDSCHCHDGQ